MSYSHHRQKCQHSCSDRETIINHKTRELAEDVVEVATAIRVDMQKDGRMSHCRVMATDSRVITRNFQIQAMEELVAAIMVMVVVAAVGVIIMMVAIEAAAEVDEKVLAEVTDMDINSFCI